MLPTLPIGLQLEVDKAANNIEKTSIPGFVNLQRHLTTQILDSDGSTRSRNQGYEASGVEEKLREYYVHSARRNILIRSLKEICLLEAKEVKNTAAGDAGGNGGQVLHKRGTVDGLPAHLRELCYIVASYLATLQTRSSSRVKATSQMVSGAHDDNDRNEAEGDIEDLMSEDIDQFYEHLPEITQCLGRYLLKLEDTIIEMIAPVSDNISSSSQDDDNNNNNYNSNKQSSSKIPHRSTTTSSRTYQPTPTTLTHPSTTNSSSSHTKTQTTHLTNQITTTIPTLLQTLIHTHSLLTQLQTTHLTSLIRHSELHTHGTQTRNIISHTTFLNTVSLGLSLKTQTTALQHEREMYARYRPTLDRRWKELEVEERGLDGRIGELEGLVREFEEQGRKGRMYHNGSKNSGGVDGKSSRGEEIWSELGREYSVVEREIEVLRKDVERLERELGESEGVAGRGGLDWGGGGGLRRKK